MTATLEASPAQTDDPFYMAGTEGTGEYKVLATSSHGRIGYRLLAGDFVRIRVEPAEGRSQRLAGDFPLWKQPSSLQYRFSQVVPRDRSGLVVLLAAYSVIKRGRPISYNPTMPDYTSDFLD